MDRLPPLSALRAFEAAARTGSLSAAGRELNVTHAAIGQQVRRLERALGAPLLTRAGRGVSPTVAGAALAAGLSDAFQRMGEAVASARRAAAVRPLRVTMTPSFAASWLTPRLGAFRQAHPDIDLVLDPSAHVIDLTREGFDLGIRFGAGDWPGLQSALLLPSDFILVAAPSLLEGRTLAEPADLLDFPWIQELGTDELPDWLSSRGVDVSDHQGSAYLPGFMLMETVRAGQGVAATARVLVREDLAAGRLVELFRDENANATEGYHLVWPPGPRPEAVDRFVAWLLEEAAAE